MEGQVAFDVLNFVSRAIFHALAGGDLERKEYQALSFCLYRVRRFRKRKNNPVLRRAKF